MSEKYWDKVKVIFDAALQHPPESRPDYLKQICAGDEELLNEIASLIESHDNAGDFINHPAIEDVAGEIENDALRFSRRDLKSFAHYEIVRQIGAGGMGEVYLANDKKLDRQVAIKILNASFSRHESNLQRFIKEARAVSSLNHPNILVIHEIGEDAQTHYIVSEFIEGKTLREILQGKNLTFKEILEIAVQITGALVAAHNIRLVHRDIKPENIIVRPDGYVKVLDFGLAKLVEPKNALTELEESARQNETAKGIILGTVNYMSPEQAKGEQVDERTDIFSFGVMIYEMIAGRTPFAAASMAETFADLINKEPTPLGAIVPNVAPELERIVAKTLVKNKDERYLTMKDLLVDLKKFQEILPREEKNERLPVLPDANKTAALPAKTDDLKINARLTENFCQLFSTRRTVIYGCVLLLLLGAVVTFFWRQNAAAAQPQIKSLAVLPLKSLDNSENYLGLGIADAVIRRISQTGELTVRPTSAVRRYLNEDADAVAAGKQLNADAVLEGSVQKFGDRLRVSVNLLRTGDGASLWADRFDLPATDAFAIQDKVSQEVAAQLQLRLNSEQQTRLNKRSTSDPVAYDYYLRGVYAFDQSGFSVNTKPQLAAAIDFYRKAIEADPNFALAHARLGYALAWMGVFIDTARQTEWAKQAEEETAKSEELDPQLAETHEARHLLFFSEYKGYQNEEAIRELLLAQQLNPNVGHEALAANFQHIGFEDLAARELQRALAVDPTSQSVQAQILNLPYLVGDYDGWFAACRKYTPNDCQSYAWYLMGKNRLDEAQKAIDKTIAKNPNDLEASQDQALLFALKGDFRRAEAEIPSVLEKHPRAHPYYHHATYAIACIYALEGNAAEAVKWLRETATSGFPCYPLFERDVNLDRIRNAPEFAQFINEQKAQYEKFKNEFQTPQAK